MMKKTALFLMALLVTFSLFSEEKKAVVGLNPGVALKQVNTVDKKLEKWAKIKAKKGTALFKKKDAATKEIMDSFIDYDFIANYLFDEKWKQETQEKKDELFDKLRKLYTDFYLEKIVYNKSFERKFIEKGKETKYIKGVPESVYITFEIQVIFKGKPVIYEFIYHLHFADKGYKMFDVEMDGVSLIRNYKKEFKKIVDKEGFDGLIKKIDNKLLKKKPSTKTPKKTKKK